MAKIRFLVVTAAAALALASCAGNNPVAPTKDALVTLEKAAYEAWKSKDAKFWDTYLWDKFTGYGSTGKLDKATAAKEYTGADCDIKTYALSDEQMQPLSNDAALLTYKTDVHGTCGGQAVPANTWAATAYVRDGERWKAAFHAEAPIVDPKTVHAKPVETPKQSDAKPANLDASTEAMLAAEKTVWEAWRVHDAKSLDSLTANDISFINIFGTYFPTKADALKNWGGTGCDVKTVSITSAAGTMLSPAAGILTFKGAADGTCFGQKVGPIWGSSIYVKNGDTWKWAFGINVPAL